MPEPRTGRRERGVRLGVALASGVFGGLCFPPFDLGPLIVIALAGLLWTWRGARPRDASLYGFAWGVGCYSVVIEWIRYFGGVAFVPLVVVMAAYVALAGAIIAVLAGRGIASPLLTAAAWVVMEALRGRWPFGGFPWADAGVALQGVPAARALAGAGGVLLISFVVVAAAGFVLDGIVAVPARRLRDGLVAGAGLVGLVLAGFVADVARYEPSTTGELKIAVLQGDDEELTLSGQQAQLLTDDHLALASRLEGDYDLIIFPESALDSDPELDASLRDNLARIAAEHDSALLVNARTPVDRSAPEAGDNYNTNLLYDRTGRLQAEYRKQHLVPFGEYVPLRAQFGDISELRQVPYDFRAGDDTVVFDVKGRRVGSVICFESAFGPLVRDFVRDGAEAIVVSTSNRSYRRSGNSEQHLALSRLRAAETGRPVVQASVSGISAVIDPDGTVRGRTDLFDKDVISATIDTTSGDTLYVRFGDWAVAGAAVALLAAAIVWTCRGVRPTT